MILLAPFVTMAWRRDLPCELQSLADLLSSRDGARDGRDTGDGQDTAPSVGWPG